MTTSFIFLSFSYLSFIILSFCLFSFLRRRGDESLVWEHLHCVGDLEAAASYAFVLAESGELVRGQRRSLLTEGGVVGRLNCLDFALSSAREGVSRGVVADERLEAILHARKVNCLVLVYLYICFKIHGFFLSFLRWVRCSAGWLQS